MLYIAYNNYQFIEQVYKDILTYTEVYRGILSFLMNQTIDTQLLWKGRNL